MGDLSEVDMILALMDCEDMTTWEYDFINSLAEQDEEELLTTTQRQKLEEIFEEYCR